MRTSFLAVIAIVVSGALAGCGKGDEPSSGASKASGPLTVSDMAAMKAKAGTANGRCPVQTAELVDPEAPTRMYKDPATGKEQKIGFCCDRCPGKFDKDPEKYMAPMRADAAKFAYTTP